MELKIELRVAPVEVAVAIIEGVDAPYVDHSPSLVHLLRRGHHRVLNRTLPHTHHHTLHHRSRLHRHSNRLFCSSDVALGHVEELLFVCVVREFHGQELGEVCVA